MARSLRRNSTFYILGVSINCLTLAMFKREVDHWIATKQRKYVVLTGAHGIVEMQYDQDLKYINNHADLVAPDGMPEVWLGRFKGTKAIEKISGINAITYLLKNDRKRRYRHFFYGGNTSAEARQIIKNIISLYPGTVISGYYSPPFKPLTRQQKQIIVDKINSSGAHIVWCGLGCPKQEKWMFEFRPHLKANILVGIGATFDFLSGSRPLAPSWLQRSGFEWLYRLATEPRRLAKRYIKIVPLFIWLNFLELTGLKKYK